MSTSVLVCTYNRPAGLRRLLGRLDEILCRAEGPFRCVVVDDSPERTAEPVVAAWRAEGRRLDVTYVFLGSRNISLARNAAADAAIDDDWWLLLDDVCEPALDWMASLFAAQARSGADLVCGGVRYVAPVDAPRWLQDQGFLDVNHYADDAEPEFGCLANALLRAGWWREHPEVRFREEFGRRGGEDLTFLIDARRAGLVVRWTERGEVVEELPARRATLRYQLRRKLWTGNVNALIDIECGVRPRRRVLARTVLKSLHLARDAVVGAVGRTPLQGRRRLGQAAFVVGMCLAVVGIDIDHR